MIVCAAIRIYVTKTNRETVICGHRHGDCFSTLADCGMKPHIDYKELCQGFITHDGTFLDRTDAYSHALACGQMSCSNRWYKQDHNEIELYSEDLY